MSEKIGIIVTLDGADKARKELTELQKTVEKINGHGKINISVNANALSGVISSIDKLNSSVRSIDSMLASTSTGFENQFGRMEDTLRNVAVAAEQTADSIQDINPTIETESIDEATESLNQATEAAYTLGDALSAVGELADGIGSAFDMIAGIGSGVGGMFSDMANMFSGGDITSNVINTLTNMGTNAVTSRLKDIMSRYDVMKTFVPYMELAGATADEANTALSKINASILGLPIGLDESAFRLRRYYMYLDDVERAQNLTIGLQRALIAGGAPESMRTMAFMQVDRLLATGKLTTARQWQSLINGLGVSAKFLREAMGYGDMSKTDFFAMLSDKEFDTDELIRGFEKLADGTTEAGKKLNEAIEIYKSTLESWASSIGFAITRGGETVTKALNELSQQLFGEELIGLAETFRDYINDFFLGVDEYMGNNPEIFDRLVESLSNVFDWIKEFDLGSLATKTLSNLSDVIDIIADVLRRIPKEDLEDFIAFAITKAGPLGKAMQALSNGLPLMLAVFDRLKEFDWGEFIDVVLNRIEKMIERITHLLEMMPDDMLMNMLAFSIVDAPIYAKFFHGLGSIVQTIMGIAIPAAVLGKITGIGKIFQKLGGLFGFGKGSGVGGGFNWIGAFKGLGLAATFIAVVGELGLVIREIAWVIDSINEMPPIDDTFDRKVSAIASFGAVMTAIVGLFTTAFGGIVATGVGGAFAVAGELLTAGLIADMGLAVDLVAGVVNVVDQISAMNLSHLDSNLSKVGEAAKSILGIFNDTIFNDVYALKGKAKNTKNIADSLVDIGESLSALDGIDAIDINFDKTSRSLTGLIQLIKSVAKEIDEGFPIGDGDTGAYAQIATNMNTVIEQMGSTITNIRNMQADLANLGISLDQEGKVSGNGYWANFKERFMGVLDFIVGDDGIYAKLHEFSGWLTQDDKWASDDFASIINNMSSVVEGMQGIFTNLNDLGEDMLENKVQIGDSGEITGWFGNALKGISGIVDYVREIFDKLREFSSGTDDYYGANAVTISDNMHSLVTNLTSAFEQMKELFRQLATLANYVDGLSYHGDGNAVFKIGVMAEQITGKNGIFHYIDQIVDAFTEDGLIKSTVKAFETAVSEGTVQGLKDIFINLNTIFLELSTMADNSEGVTGTSIQAIADKVDAIKEPVEDIVTAIHDIASFATSQGIDTGQMASKSTDIASAMTALEEMLSSLYQMSNRIATVYDNELGLKLQHVVMTIKGAFALMPTDAGEVRTKAQAFRDSVSAAFETIQMLSEKHDELMQVANNDDASTFSKVISDMTSAFAGSEEIGSMTEIVTSMSSIISNLAGSLSQLSSTDLSSLIDSMGDLQSKADELNGVLDTLVNTLRDIQRTSSYAKNGLDYLATTAETNAGRFGGLMGTLGVLASQLSLAAVQAYGLANAINSIPAYKEIVVNVRQGGFISGVANKVASLYRADGGTVYAASGFHKRGTDVVPAMLTPGEFVVRKAAVDSFGARFMRHINSLNIDGALADLLSARRLPSMTPTVVNNSRSYDNHATVNQNIYTNNQHFSQRRAYRWVTT